MPRPNLIGASNRQTNRTSVFGSLAGLAPTTGVRPHVTGLNGYKFARVAANGIRFSDNTWLSKADYDGGCGLSRGPESGKKCVLETIGYNKHVNQYRTGKTMLG